MTRTFMSVVLLALLVAFPKAVGAYPRPSVYPVAWELEFTSSLPKRISVKVPGNDVPQAFWYITYKVTNNDKDDQTFLPLFEFLSEDGQVLRSDNNISPVVFEAIKGREKNSFLEPAHKVSGRLLIGEDNAKEGVAIWREPAPELGRFSIFVGNLSGENVILQKQGDDYVRVDKGEQLLGIDVKDLLVLRKTLQLNYFVRGDEVYPGEDAVNEDAQVWIMR